MPFRGISIDDEGSIIYDGEKFVVNHPSRVPDNFDPGDKPVVGLPKTHPSHPQNRQRPPTPENPPPPPYGGPGPVIPGIVPIRPGTPPKPANQPHPTPSLHLPAPPPGIDIPGYTQPHQPVQEASDNSESEKKKKKRQETGSSEPSLPDFPQDMEYQPDISALGLVNFETKAAVMKIINGHDPDDDEQDTEQAWNNHLRILGLNDVFSQGDWYTTRLGTPFQNDSIDMAFADGNIGILQPPKPVAEEAHKTESQRINLVSLDHLRKYVDGWDETWTTETDLSHFIIDKFANDYGIQVPDDFADLSVEEQVMTLLQSVHYHREAYYSKTWQYESPHPLDILEEDYHDFLPLPELLDPRPLNDLNALLEVLGLESGVDAVDYLRPKVGLVYAKLGHEVPENWGSVENAVLMANMLHTGIEDMFIRHESDSTFLSDYDPAVIEFRDRYFNSGYSTINEDYQRLSGTSDSSLFGFVLSVLLSIAFEPVDWGLTGAEVVDAASKEDWGSVLLNTGLLLLPGVPGYTDNLMKLPDELADLARRLDIDLQSLGARNLIKRNDLVNRGFTEQTVDDMISGKATRPAWGQGHGKAEGLLEVPGPRASRREQMQIRAQNDVTHFLGDEGGYHVISLGPNQHNLFRDNLQRSINYRGTGNPDIVIMYRDLDGTMVAREFDIYTPISNNDRTITETIKGKVRDRDSGVYRQADRIVLNLELTQSDVNLQSLKGRLERENTHFLKEIIIVDQVNGDYEIIDVWTFNP